MAQVSGALALINQRRWLTDEPVALIMTAMQTLKPIRSLLGVTQKELGVGIECSQGNVANYESGQQSMPVHVAKRLIDYAFGRGLVLSLDQVYDRAPLPEQVAQQGVQEASHG
jgi:putative transcriptional regulator